MRGFDCPCGEYLTGANDAQLLEHMRRHTQEAHRDEDYPDSRLQSMIDESAYDVQEESPTSPLA
jgi:hypothetical protein